MLEEAPSLSQEYFDLWVLLADTRHAIYRCVASTNIPNHRSSRLGYSLSLMI